MSGSTGGIAGTLGAGGRELYGEADLYRGTFCPRNDPLGGEIGAGSQATGRAVPPTTRTKRSRNTRLSLAGTPEIPNPHNRVRSWLDYGPSAILQPHTVPALLGATPRAAASEWSTAAVLGGTRQSHAQPASNTMLRAGSRPRRTDQTSQTTPDRSGQSSTAHSTRRRRVLSTIPPEASLRSTAAHTQRPIVASHPELSPPVGRATSAPEQSMGVAALLAVPSIGTATHPRSAANNPTHTPGLIVPAERSDSPSGGFTLGSTPAVPSSNVQASVLRVVLPSWLPRPTYLTALDILRDSGNGSPEASVEERVAIGPNRRGGSGATIASSGAIDLAGVSNDNSSGPSTASEVLVAAAGAIGGVVPDMLTRVRPPGSPLTLFGRASPQTEQSPTVAPAVTVPGPDPSDFRQLAENIAVILELYNRTKPGDGREHQLIGSANDALSKFRKHHGIGECSTPQPGVSNTRSEDVCIVCYEQIADIVLLPCNHLVLCGTCCDKLGVKEKEDGQRADIPCPMCRTVVTRRIKVYRG